MLKSFGWLGNGTPWSTHNVSAKEVQARARIWQGCVNFLLSKRCQFAGKLAVSVVFRPLPTYFQKLFSRLAGWLSFSQAVWENVRAELLGYKRFSSLKLAAAHSRRESAYLATDCKGKGKIIIFPFHLFNYPVGDIDCIWVTLITKALLSLPSSALRLKVENKNIKFSKMHIFSLAALGASQCQVSNCIRPYSSIFNVTASWVRIFCLKRITSRSPGQKFPIAQQQSLLCKKLC